LLNLLPPRLAYRFEPSGRQSPAAQQELAARLLRVRFSLDLPDLYDARALVGAASEVSREGVGSRDRWQQVRDRILKAIGDRQTVAGGCAGSGAGCIRLGKQQVGGGQPGQQLPVFVYTKRRKGVIL
jgi:hypothetical protein